MKVEYVNLTIDGMSIEVEKGSTVLQAARQVGINIPTVCYMENLSPYGGC
ncbi:MAG: 2Fe-2S iron-sulfur cluster-binding protein, partial [Proteobacteria bacterium]|nr:2Fe-2S iron-sulfur cluster-binding protein [Pseudomonadota bacterium]